MQIIKVLLTSVVVLLTIIAFELRRSAWTNTPPPLQPQLPFAESKLNERISTFKLDNVSVSDAVKALSSRCGIPISVDWAGLTSSNEPPVSTRVVTLDMSDVPVWAILKSIFAQPSLTWDDSLHFAVVGDTVFVTRGQSLATIEMSLCVYDVRDLLSDDRWGSASDPATVAIRKREVALIDAIRAYSVAGDWRPQPTIGGLGMGANMCIYSGDLIVVESSYGHRKVQEFLAQLRNPVMVTRE
jgi:hypothetical protein